MLGNKLLQLEVEEILSTHILKLNQNIHLKDALDQMIKENIPEVLIVEEDNQRENLLGIISLTDISKLVKENADTDLPLSYYMNTGVISIDSDKNITEAREVIFGKKIGRLPVFKNDNVVGIVRKNHILERYSMILEFINRQFKPIINHMDEGVAVTDTKGNVLVWNLRAEEMYGIKAEEILYKKLESFFPDALMLSVLENQVAIRNKFHSPKEGDYAVISASPIYINDEFWGVVTAERDVTDYMNISLELENANSQLSLLKEEVEKITKNFLSIGHIQGKSPKMQKVVELGKRVAKTSTSILITGESGTGKEVLSRAIHKNSERQGLFVPVNCSAIPHMLFESEFFGYVGGSFTGALKEGKTGYFELANNGTLFLDEIGDLPIEVQAKLLRILQEGSVYRVGSGKPINVDVRLISATNKDLKAMVERGEFREDLYYRLNVVEIELPPLRERKEDIVLLFDHFLKEICEKNDIWIENIEKDVLDTMIKCSWKGNIRELRNTVEHMVVMAANHEISKDSIPEYIREDTSSTLLPDTIKSLNLESTLKALEKELIIKAMDKACGNKAEAARHLGIPRSTLYYKIDQFS